MDEVEVMVVEATSLDVHGVIYHDVTFAYRDRSVDRARLGPEGVPDDLVAGEVVLATKVANMVISLRRPSPPPTLGSRGGPKA
jgi:hypothetical protein